MMNIAGVEDDYESPSEAAKAERAKIVAKIRANAADFDRDAKASAEFRDGRGCDKYTYAAMALTRVADQIGRGDY